MTRPGPEFDKFRAEADLTGLVVREWTGMPCGMRLNGEDYRFGYLEDGRPEDDPSAIFIVRRSDGMRLECEVWVSLYQADPADTRQTEEVAVEGEVL